MTDSPDPAPAEIDAELQELARQRDAGQLTEIEYNVRRSVLLNRWHAQHSAGARKARDSADPLPLYLPAATPGTPWPVVGGPAAPARRRPRPPVLVVAAILVLAVAAGTGGALLVLHVRNGSSAPASPSMTSGAAAAVVVRSGHATLTRVALDTGAVDQTIAVSGSPTHLLVTPDRSAAYLLDTSGGTVLPINLASGTATEPIGAGKLPVDMRLSASGSALYVTDNLSGSVIPIDTRTNTRGPAQQLQRGVDAFIPSPRGQSALALVYSGQGQPGLAVVISATGGRAIEVGSNDVSTAAFSPDGGTAWAVEQGVGGAVGALYPIDVATAKAGSPITLGHAPEGLTLTPDGSTAVIPNGQDNTVSVVDLHARRVAATVPVGSVPLGAELSPDGHTAWVPCVLDRSLVPVDIATRKAGVAVDLHNAPADVALAADGHHAWVLFPSSAGTVATISSAGGLRAPINVGNQAHAVMTPDGSTAYAVNSLDDSVQILDLLHGTAGPAIGVPRGPTSAALSSDGRRLLVVSYGNGQGPGTLSVVDPAAGAVTSDVGIAPRPGTVVAVKDPGIAFVSFEGSTSVSVVDLQSRHVASMITLPCAPGGGLVRTSSSSTILAVCRDDQKVVPIDVASRAARAPVAVGTNARVTAAPNADRVYIASVGRVDLLDVATGRMIATHSESGNIIGVDVSADGQSVVAIDNTGEGIVSLDPATLATRHSLALGGRPDAVAVSRDGRTAFVLETTRQKVDIVDIATWTLSASVDASTNPRSIAVPSALP